MKEIKLPFGLKDDTLIHISQAEQGIACGCVCPSCRATLVARKGSIKIHHFAHQNGQPCQYAVETALHLASKQLLSECHEISLPSVDIRFRSYREPLTVTPAATYRLDEVWEERRTEDIVPDLLARVGTSMLMIEIYVTHPINPTKLDKIRRLGISAIEIDLSSASRDFSPASLRDALVNQTKNKAWLFNANAEELKRHLLQTGERKDVIRRGCALHVDYCPINARIWQDKSYANVIDDCINCEYCFDLSEDKNALICGGLHKVTTSGALCIFEKHHNSTS